MPGTWNSSPAAVGFELTDGDGAGGYVTDNTVAFNDFRGSSIEMLFNPDGAEAHNTVSWNLGKNRGHGVTPASNLFR